MSTQMGHLTEGWGDNVRCHCPQKAPQHVLGGTQAGGPEGAGCGQPSPRGRLGPEQRPHALAGTPTPLSPAPSVLYFPDHWELGLSPCSALCHQLPGPVCFPSYLLFPLLVTLPLSPSPRPDHCLPSCLLLWCRPPIPGSISLWPEQAFGRPLWPCATWLETPAGSPQPPAWPHAPPHLHGLPQL